MTKTTESVVIVRDKQGIITHVIINDMTSRHTLVGTWTESGLEETAELIEKGVKNEEAIKSTNI